MLTKTARLIQKNSVWLVLFFHCLLFSGVSFEWIASPKLLKAEEEEHPSLFIPSYVYHDNSPTVSSPAMPANVSPVKSPEQIPLTPPKKAVPISKIGTEKPVLTSARPALNTSHPIDISHSRETEPVHLVGDKKIDRPLLTLLGKALTKYLIYPKSALDLNVKGTSIIGFLLYPDGHVTDVQLLKTSRAEVLDRAALTAATAIGPVQHVSQYLDKPKWMVIGIIFE